jgi:hypothetical protein
MTMQVRRVVTGHGENGNAVVVSDERLAAVSRGVGRGISGCEMWSTNRMPIDNSAVRVRPPVSLRGTVRVVYEAGSPGGCSGGAGSCDPIQISVHVGARGAGCSPDGVGG